MMQGLLNPMPGVGPGQGQQFQPSGKHQLIGSQPDIGAFDYARSGMNWGVHQLAIGPNSNTTASQFGRGAPWMQPAPWMQSGSMPQGGGLLYPWSGNTFANPSPQSSGGLLQNVGFGSGNGWFA